MSDVTLFLNGTLLTIIEHYECSIWKIFQMKHLTSAYHPKDGFTENKTCWHIIIFKKYIFRIYF